MIVDPHEIIPISFNMQGTLQDKYYNISSLEKCLVQTMSQVKPSGIELQDSSWWR